MDSNSILSIFVHALIYPLTRISAFFTGLLVGLSCFILVGSLLVPGYAVRCGRHVMNGDFQLPTWGKDDDSLLENGSKALCRNDLSRALNPSNAFGLLAARPIVFLKAGIVDYVAINILSIPTTIMGIIALAYLNQLPMLCLLALVFLVVLGFEAFILMCARMFIWANYYRMVIVSIEEEQEATKPVA